MSRNVKILLIITGVVIALVIIYKAYKNYSECANVFCSKKDKIIKKCIKTDTQGNCITYQYTKNGKVLVGKELNQQLESGAEVIDDDLTSF